jgi:hypothetical protein
MTYPASLDNVPANWANAGDSIGPETLLLYASISPTNVNTTLPIKTLTAITGYTEVYSTPSVGQYRVYYRTKVIQFGPIAYDTSVTINYVTSGTVFDAHQIDTIATSINNIEGALGLNPQGSSLSVAARLSVLSASQGYTIHMDQFIITTPTGAYSVTLNNIPATPICLVFRNTELLSYFAIGANAPQYTVTGSVITIDAAVIPEDQDVLTIVYFS